MISGCRIFKASRKRSKYPVLPGLVTCETDKPSHRRSLRHGPNPRPRTPCTLARAHSPPSPQRADAQFCARERLPLASFHAWKRRLRLIDLADHRPALPAPSAFLPVTVRVVEHAHDESLPIEAELPNGIRLRIPTTNQRLASHLVRVVARARTDSGGSR